MSEHSERAGAASGLDLIGELIARWRGAQVLFAAVSLGTFDVLSGGARGAGSVAEAIGADRRATEVLLDALAAEGMVEKAGGRYRNSDLAERHLVSDAPGSVASNLRYQQLLAGAWAALPEVVRTGRPKVSLGDLLGGRPEFARVYVEGMADIAKRPAEELSAGLELADPRDALDVGGGPGTYARALVNRYPGLRVVLLDLEPTLRIARERLADCPERSRIELRAGDYHEADYGAGAFDLVLLSHVTHDEGEAENRRLLGKAFGALRRGGTVVVHDFMLDADRTRPLYGALFSVHMLVYTQKGRTYSAEEYDGWIKDAGFTGVERWAVCARSPTPTWALIARKP